MVLSWSRIHGVRVRKRTSHASLLPHEYVRLLPERAEADPIRQHEDRSHRQSGERPGAVGHETPRLLRNTTGLPPTLARLLR
jgi:hypothetical protein